ncbi:MAG: alanine racemase [Alphaproteobacteria bacterium]|nr:alanine racemase [Alphaproteobacteria bacterium]
MSNTFKLEIDLQAICHNYEKLIQNGHKIIPVVKANAYGHGLGPVSEALEKYHPDYFAVGTVKEGLRLRTLSCVKTKLLALLGTLQKEDFLDAFQNDILLSLHNFEQIEELKEVCKENNLSAVPVVLKFNTGMNRFGFNVEELDALLDTLSVDNFIMPELVFSHFSCSEDENEKAYSLGQITLFKNIVEALKTKFPQIKSSLSNSAGDLCFNDTSFDYTRAGFTLYGGNPLEGTSSHALGEIFFPAMSVKAPLLEIRTVQKGATLSYNRTFTAPKDMKIGVVGIGYAHGYPRILSDKAEVMISGKRAKVLGRVCMEVILIDLTEIENVALYQDVYLMGGQGKNAVSASELAVLAETIPYEIWCNFGNNLSLEY